MSKIKGLIVNNTYIQTLNAITQSFQEIDRIARENLKNSSNTPVLLVKR